MGSVLVRTPRHGIENVLITGFLALAAYRQRYEDMGAAETDHSQVHFSIDLHRHEARFNLFVAQQRGIERNANGGLDVGAFQGVRQVHGLRIFNLRVCVESESIIPCCRLTALRQWRRCGSWCSA